MKYKFKEGELKDETSSPQDRDDGNELLENQTNLIWPKEKAIPNDNEVIFK